MKVKNFSNFINEAQTQPTFMRLGSKGKEVFDLQQALTALGFDLPKFGIDSKFGPETFGASQDVILSIARITNLSEIVGDPNITEFNQDGLTRTQYNIIVMVGQNPLMVAQLKPRLKAPGNATATPTIDTSISGSAVGKAKDAYNFFISKGYSPAGASGIIANIKTESSFKTNAVGDGGLARSLAQWHPDRFNELTKKGFNLMDFGSALAAIDWELKNNYPRTYNKIKNATSPQIAAQIFDKEFERSAGTTTQTRMRDAEQYHQQFSNVA
jgi:peptidoglycan hydrolase-like protein with peptidoglycan-binding domain